MKFMYIYKKEDKARSLQKHHHFQLFAKPVQIISEHLNSANNNSCSLLSMNVCLRSSIGIEIYHTFVVRISLELFWLSIIKASNYYFSSAHRNVWCVHAKCNVPNAQLHIKKTNLSDSVPKAVKRCFFVHL